MLVSLWKCDPGLEMGLIRQCCIFASRKLKISLYYLESAHPYCIVCSALLCFSLFCLHDSVSVCTFGNRATTGRSWGWSWKRNGFPMCRRHCRMERKNWTLKTSRTAWRSKWVSLRDACLSLSLSHTGNLNSLLSKAGRAVSSDVGNVRLKKYSYHLSSHV